MDILILLVLCIVCYGVLLAYSKKAEETDGKIDFSTPEGKRARLIVGGVVVLSFGAVAYSVLSSYPDVRRRIGLLVGMVVIAVVYWVRFMSRRSK